MAKEKLVAGVQMNKFVAWMAYIIMGSWDFGNFPGELYDQLDVPEVKAFGLVVAGLSLGVWCYIVAVLRAKQRMGKVLMYAIVTFQILYLIGYYLINFLVEDDIYMYDDSTAIILLVSSIILILCYLAVDITLIVKYKGAMRNYAIADIVYGFVSLGVVQFSENIAVEPHTPESFFVLFLFLVYYHFFERMLTEKEPVEIIQEENK